MNSIHATYIRTLVFSFCTALLFHACEWTFAKRVRDSSLWGCAHVECPLGRDQHLAWSSAPTRASLCVPSKHGAVFPFPPAAIMTCDPCSVDTMDLCQAFAPAFCSGTGLDWMLSVSWKCQPTLFLVHIFLPRGHNDCIKLMTGTERTRVGVIPTCCTTWDLSPWATWPLDTISFLSARISSFVNYR